MQLAQPLNQLLTATEVVQQSLLWRDHPVTQLLLQGLQAQVEGAQEAWVMGAFQSSDPDTERAINTAEQAAVNVVAQIIYAIREIKMPEPEIKEPESAE